MKKESSKIKNKTMVGKEKSNQTDAKNNSIRRDKGKN